MSLKSGILKMRNILRDEVVGGVFEGVALTYKLIDGHPDSPPGSAEVAESFKQHLVPTSVQEKSC